MYPILGIWGRCNGGPSSRVGALPAHFQAAACPATAPQGLQEPAAPAGSCPTKHLAGLGWAGLEGGWSRVLKI